MRKDGAGSRMAPKAGSVAKGLKTVFFAWSALGSGGAVLESLAISFALQCVRRVVGYQSLVGRYYEVTVFPVCRRDPREDKERRSHWWTRNMRMCLCLA